MAGMGHSREGVQPQEQQMLPCLRQARLICNFTSELPASSVKIATPMERACLSSI